MTGGESREEEGFEPVGGDVEEAEDVDEEVEEDAEADCAVRNVVDSVADEKDAGSVERVCGTVDMEGTEDDSAAALLNDADSDVGAIDVP